MSQYLDVALEAAKNAEAVLMNYFDAQIAYERKSDNSPVTIADREAEQIIRDTITKYFPTHSIIGEEHGNKPGDTEYQWILDPIDGTKNFLRGMRNFGTLIAFIKDGHITASVSNMPALQECMWAEKGSGTYLNDVRTCVSSVKDLKDAYIVHGGIDRIEQKGLHDPLLELYRHTMGHRGTGDCWMYHLVAQGKADIILEAEVKAWDIVAGALLVSEAGGKTSDIEGREINAQSTSILATNNYLYNEVFAMLKLG